MDENPYIPRDLERTVQGGLREVVGHAEPSPAVWESIRQRIAAEGERRPRPSWSPLKVRQAVPIVAAAMVMFVGLGLGMRLSALPGDEPGHPLQLGAASGIEESPLDLDPEGTLSVRVRLLAAREPSPRRARVLPQWVPE